MTRIALITSTLTSSSTRIRGSTVSDMKPYATDSLGRMVVPEKDAFERATGRM